MTKLAPTLQSSNWQVTDFYDSLDRMLVSGFRADELRMYFYAATVRGWNLIKSGVDQWRAMNSKAKVVAYIGTDHGITDVASLRSMRISGVEVRMMIHHDGVFHPKVVWFPHGVRSALLVGSNNLSLDGLKSNVEFATVTELKARAGRLEKWHREVHRASELLSDDLLASYEEERNGYNAEKRKKGYVGEFTWSKKTGRTIRKNEKKRQQKSGVAEVSSIKNVRNGERMLVLEIMPKETSELGNQIQVPSGATSFFGLSKGKVTTTVALVDDATGDSRSLTMTRFTNHTTRLSIRELELSDRPCVILFKKEAGRRYAFQIVKKSTKPGIYRALLAECGQQRRIGSRRWGYVFKSKFS
ncbi:MAG: phospholipase D family protein [Akkermansiaceae bacterium]|nr:phospholipase D family protein [Akkermansiaceae bacterium]